MRKQNRSNVRMWRGLQERCKGLRGSKAIVLAEEQSVELRCVVRL